MNRRDAIQKTALGASAAAFLPLSIQAKKSEEITIDPLDIKNEILNSIF